MRLLVSAFGIVVGFVFGAWGIALLLPGTPAWVGVTLCIVWLFALIAIAFLLGNKGPGSQRETRQLQHRLRDNLLYIGIAFVPVTILFAVAIHDLDKGIHRNIKENWVVCAITAAAVLGFSIKEFWRVRRCWRMWGILAGYVAFHFSLGVPALGQLDRIGAGYIYLIAMPELMLISFVLHLATAKQTHSW